MEEIEKLARELDDIDEKFGNIAQDSSNPLWTVRVNQKDRVAGRIDELIRTITEPFPLSSYLLSVSNGCQTVAVHWIRFKKDPTYLDLICYMLLNSSSNFLKYYILTTLADIKDQCDYHQLNQINQTLRSYLPPEPTARSELKLSLLEIIGPEIDFSITAIIRNSYWWRDVESKFFNSLSGISKYRLRSLHIIRNRKLFERFDQCRARLREKTQLFFVYHGSSPESLRAIAKSGFFDAEMLARTPEGKKKLDDGYFGRGIYHGFAADYAIYYAEQYRQSDEILLSVVLPGRSYTVKKGGEKFGRDCEPGYNSHISPELREIVLFQTAQILPLFIIRIERVPNAEIVEEQL